MYTIFMMSKDNNTQDRSYRTSVKALILNDKSELLLVREGNKEWNLPGGGVDWGESPHAALHRELVEELGTDGDISDLPIAVLPFNNDALEVHLLWIVYEVVLLDITKIRPTPDVSGHTHMKLDDYLKICESQEQSEWVCAVDLRQTLQALIER